MALSVYTGTFSTGTGALSSTVAITGLGFQPKALIVWWSGTTSVANAVARGSHYRGFGFASGPSDRRAAIATSADAGTSSDGGAYHSNAALIISADHAGAIDGALDVQSFDTDGFTLIVDDVMPRSMTVGYMALGGADLTNIASGQFTSPLATGNQDITSVGFQPDALLFIVTGNPTAPPDGQTTTSVMGFGAAVSSSQRAVWAGSQDDGSSTMDTGAYALGSEAIAIHNGVSGVALDMRADFSAMLSNGFRLNWLAVAGQAYYVHYLALKGGSYRVDSLTTQTDTVTGIAESGFGFAPGGAILVSAARAASTAGTPTAHDFLSVGAFHSTSARHAFGVLDENATANAEVTLAFRTDAAYVNIDTSSAIQGLGDVQSMDSDGFTLIMDDADPSGAFAWYFAAGSTPASGISGDAAITQAGNTVAATGTLDLAGTATITQAGNTVAATGTLDLAGTATITQGGDTVAATGAGAGVAGDATITQAGNTVAATGALDIAGAATITQGGDMVAATGAGAGVAGDAAITQAGNTVAAVATLDVAGTASITQAGDMVAATGALDIAGAATIAQAGDAVFATGGPAPGIDEIETLVASTTATSSITFASWTPAANNLIGIWVACRQGVTASSIAGNGITFVKVFEDTGSPQNQCTLSFWRGMSASPTTGAIVVTLSGSAVAAIAVASRFSGADTSGSNGAGAIGAFDVANTGATDTTAPSVGLTTTAADSLVLGGATHRNQTYSVGAGETQLSLNNSVGTAGDVTSLSIEYQLVPSVSTVTINGTLGSAIDWIQGAVEIKVAPVVLQATAAITQAGNTVAAVATLDVAGSAAITQVGNTVAAVGALDIGGSVAITQGGDTLVATALGAGLSADAALTQAGDTLAATATLDIAGSAAITQAGDGIVSAGIGPGAGISADAGLTQADNSIVATGILPIAANAGLTQGGDTLASAGTGPGISGTASMAQAGNTVAATGTGPVTPAVLAENSVIVPPQSRIFRVAAEIRSVVVAAITRIFEALNMALVEINKDPGATLDYTINWATYLAGDTIANSVWAGDAGITVGASSFTNTTATVRLSGGTAGQRYKVKNTVTLASGQIEVRRLVIAIAEL